jgi:hypothetical protein
MTGCSAQPTETVIKDLEQKISDQNSRIAKLEEMVVEQSFKIYLLEEDSSNKAILDPTGSSGYSKTGNFLVSISNIEEYLDGCKVYLEVGNPHNALYSGYTINARYGTRANFSDANFDYEAWENSLKEKEIKVSSDLDRGTWNKAEIILPSIDAKDLSYLELEILTDTIVLFNN